MTRQATLFVLVLASVGLVAQESPRPLLYVGEESAADIRWAKSSDFDGSILFCRGSYTSTRYEANGSGWITDHPGADHNLLTRLSELTKVRVRIKDRIPFHVALGLSDPLLFKCPILFMSDVGTIGFTTSEVSNMRDYFDKGGFLWVDDFWGSQAWTQWESEIRRILPTGEYRLFEIPNTHPIFHQLYDVEIWQMPTIGLWGTCGVWTSDDDSHESCPGGTSERGDDSATPHFRGLEDARGRLAVVMSFNTDIADSFEEEGKSENQAFVNEFSARGYALAINIFLYALTH